MVMMCSFNSKFDVAIVPQRPGLLVISEHELVFRIRLGLRGTCCVGCTDKPDYWSPAELATGAALSRPEKETC